MRFLVDQNLSARLAELLEEAGHEAVHVRPLGLSRASDAVILDRADKDSRVLVSADTDFGALLAADHRRHPSLILFRRERPRRAELQAVLLLNHLDAVAAELDDGAIVVIEQGRLRVRSLPVLPEDNDAGRADG